MLSVSCTNICVLFDPNSFHIFQTSFISVALGWEQGWFVRVPFYFIWFWAWPRPSPSPPKNWPTRIILHFLGHSSLKFDLFFIIPILYLDFEVYLKLPVTWMGSSELNVSVSLLLRDSVRGNIIKPVLQQVSQVTPEPVLISFWLM